MGNKIKATIYGVVVSVTNSILTIVLNLIYNNYLIRNYGSSMNGLISTLAQFVSLFSIIEGGFTTAAIVAMYAPVVSKDYDKMSDILYTAKKVYKRIGIIITVCVFSLGSIYLLLIDSPMSYAYTYVLLVLTVASTTFSIVLIAGYSILLQGDNKEYLFNSIALACRIITWGLSMFLIINQYHILLVFAVNVVNVILNWFLLYLYRNKHYRYLKNKAKYDSNLIVGTGDVLFQKIAGTVFTSTDLVLISVCLDLKMASVYNLYNQVFRNVLNLLLGIIQAPFNSFGQLANSENERDKFVNYADVYQHLVLMMVTFALTVIGITIIPFVRLYTSKITDCNYVMPVLAVLFFLQIFLQAVNRPYGSMLNSTGNFKMQNLQCGISVIVNLVFSVLFIRLFGVYSIIFGSVLGTLVILVMNIYQLYVKVLKVKIGGIIKNITANMLLGLAGIILCIKFNYRCSSYLELLIYGVVNAVIVGIIVLLFNLIVCRKSTQNVLGFLKNKIAGRKK